MTQTLNSNWRWIVLALLLLASYALRIHRLDAVPLRGDEAYTALHGTTTPFTELWREVMETQPNPGMLTAYWLWSEVVGLSEFALRYINLLTNVTGLAVMIALAHRMQRDWRISALVGVLWLINPFFLWHAQDARHYAFTTLLTPLSFYLFLRALDRSDQRDWGFYLVVQALALYVNILDAFFMIAQGLYLLSLRRWDLLRRGIMTWLLMAVLLIPLAYQTYLVRVQNAYGGTSNPAELRLLFEDFPATLLFGPNTWPGWVGGLILALLVIGVALFALRRVLLLGWIVIPFVLLYLFSLNTSIFEPRYVINSAPALLLAIVITAQGIGGRLNHALRRRRTYSLLPNAVLGERQGVRAGNAIRSRSLLPSPIALGEGLGMGVIITAIIVVFSLIEINDYFYHDTPKASDWRGLVAYLEERVSERDVIISGSIDPALEYYYTGPGRVLFIPADEPEVASYLDDVLEEHRAVYLLAGERTGPVGQYLQDHSQSIPGDSWPGVSQFRRWRVDPAEIQTTLDIQLGDIALLRGMTIVGDSSLLLYWEALEQTETDHSVLLHLEHAPDMPPVVLDHGIASAVVSSRTWQPGTLYRDPVALPVLPAGSYAIQVGMYPTGTDDLLLAQDDAKGAGRYLVGVLEVGTP